jgi:hypothetical protein
MAEKKTETGARNRGSGNVPWKFTSTFALSDVIGLDRENCITKCIGVMAGLPIKMSLDREKEDTLGLYVQPLMPELQGETFASCLDRRVGLKVFMESNYVVRSFHCFFKDGDSYGSIDFFRRPWEEVVHENSFYFPEGKMAVTIKFKKLTKYDKETRER